MYSNLIFINNTKWHIKTFHRLHHQLKKKMNISKVPQSYMGRMGRKYILFLCYKDLFELKPLNVISGNVVRKNRVPIYYVKKKKKDCFSSPRLWEQVCESQKRKKSWAFRKMQIPGEKKCVKSFL